MNSEDFVTFEQALKLRELGFDCHNLYNQMYYATQNYCEGNNPFFFDTIGPGDLISSPRMKEDENDGWIEDDDYCVLAPTLAETQKWLREKRIFLYIQPLVFKSFCVFEYIIDRMDTIDRIESKPQFDTYELALSAGIDKAFELLKEESK